METGLNVTGYDLAIFGIVLLFVGRGVWLGLLKQVTGLLALYFGYLAASQYHDRLFPFLKDISENPKVGFITSVVVLFVVTYVVVTLVGKGLALVMEITLSKWFDRILGAILGAAKAVIVVVLVHMVLGSILAPESSMLRDCQSCQGLNMATEYARAFIRDEDVRKSLIQQTPAISAEAVRKILEDPQQPAVQEDPSAPIE